MKASQLKYAEIFSFLAFIFFMLFIVLFISINQNPDKNPIPELPVNLPKTIPDRIIIYEKTNKFQFEKGEATLPKDLKNFIESDIVPKIEETFQNYDIDTIEVIGHTDGQPIKNTSSNLDKFINKVATGSEPLEKLQAGSNADLGLMRALAVVQELQNKKEQGKLLQILAQKKLDYGKIFRVYSAGQLIKDGHFAPYNPYSDTGRRRIEIRFTKLGKDKNQSENQE